VINIMTRLADWLITHEADSAKNCSVPDEIIDDWLNTIDQQLKQIAADNRTETGHDRMLRDLDARVREIKAIRAKQCRHSESNNAEQTADK